MSYPKNTNNALMQDKLGSQEPHTDMIDIEKKKFLQIYDHPFFCSQEYLYLKQRDKYQEDMLKVFLNDYQVDKVQKRWENKRFSEE